MPPKGTHGSVPMSKKKKSEGTTAELIDISKPVSDENIELGDSIPVVKLNKIDSPHRSKVIPSSDTWGRTVPDEDTRVAAEVLQPLNKQQPGVGHHLCLTQSTPPGEAESFKGGGLMKNIRESVKRHKMHNSPISQPPAPITPTGLILTITVGILPPAKVLAVDLTNATLREGSPNLLKVTTKFIGWKTTNESTHSHDADHRSGPKDSTVPSSRRGVSATCSSVPGSSGGAAGGSGQGPGKPKQEVAHLAMVVSDDNEFTDDPHQIIPTEMVFTVPAFPKENFEGLDEGYLLPAEVTAFRGIYYHESGDVQPSYTGAFPFDYPLDCQGHVASKLHSGTAAYSSYIGLILTRIVYPKQEDPAVPIDQYGYFDIISMIPPITNHGIWGCLHFLLLVSNVFLCCYDSGTFLSHLTEGGYGFNVLGSPGIDMYQMYIVAPMVKAGMTYVGVGLIYKPHGLFAGGIKRCATFLRTFFDRCESEVDVAPSQAYFLWKRRGVGPLFHPMPTWICANSIITCPGMIDKEGADMVGVHSS